MQTWSSMTLLQPTYLWGLLGLIIPIAIHLWSKRKVKIIKVGSTQFIAETKSKQSNSLQINEWWLLLLRGLLLAVLILILTQPTTTQNPKNIPIAYIFEPALIDTPEKQSSFNTLPLDNRFLLQEGLPKWEEKTVISTKNTAPSYWQLAREIATLRADSVVVFSQQLLQGVKGKRPSIGKNINWIPITSQEEKEVPFYALRDQDSITLLSAVGGSDYHAFAKAKKATSQFKLKDSTISVTQNRKDIQIPILKRDTLRVDIVHNRSFATEAMYLKAAIKAVEKYTQQPLFINTLLEEEASTYNTTNYLIWLSPNDIPKVDVPMLTYRKDIFAPQLLTRDLSTNITSLTQRLSPAVVIENNLVVAVLEWLDLGKPIAESFKKYDERSLAVEQFLPHFNKEMASQKREIKASLIKPLWVLLLVIIIAERILAKIRKQ